MTTDRPNVSIFHVDNLGYGELGCYGGGILRGADTKRLDEFAEEWLPTDELCPGSPVLPHPVGADDRSRLHPLR